MTTVLGIDTSCDDTGVGIVRNGRVLANAVRSQTALHARYGGVMPEQASREHLEVLDEVLLEALAEAGVQLADVDCVAATYGPGLVGALLVGLSYGKALAWARQVPFVPVHHLEGHIAAAVTGSGLEPPFLCLIASGGHTSLFLLEAPDVVVELGRSLDDAAGEAFDKVARALGLPYPGGPALAALAEAGDARNVRLPQPLRAQKGFDFSFSGLKTAVAIRMERDPDLSPSDMAAAFQTVVIRSLVDVVTRAASEHGVRDLAVAGGVAANVRLREAFAATDLNVVFPPAGLSTDNGAMIALAAEARLRGQGRPLPSPEDAWATDAQPYVPLAEAAGRA